jgi:hypothetical protein
MGRSEALLRCWSVLATGGQTYSKTQPHFSSSPGLDRQARGPPSVLHTQLLGITRTEFPNYGTQNFLSTTAIRTTMATESANSTSRPERSSSQHEVQFLLATLACQTWTLSCYLDKASLRVPKARSRLESYVNRLEDQSTIFLYLCSKLRTHLAEEGQPRVWYSLNSDFELWGLKICYQLTKPFHALYQAICLYTGNFKDRKPEIEAVSQSKGEKFMICPFTETGHEIFEDALDRFEEWASKSILRIICITGTPLDFDIELDRQV